MEDTNRHAGHPEKPAGPSAAGMLELMNTNHAPLRDWGLPHITWTKGMRILDVGCGGGATIAEMLRLSPESSIDGIDYSDESVEASRRLNAEHLGYRVDIRKADVTELPFVDNTFDLVTAVETVYFWPEIDRAIAEIRRVLKPYGVLAILNEGSDPDETAWPDVDGFCRIYRPEELTGILRAAGMNAVRYYRGEGQYICVLGRK